MEEMKLCGNWTILLFYLVPSLMRADVRRLYISQMSRWVTHSVWHITHYTINTHFRLSSLQYYTARRYDAHEHDQCIYTCSSLLQPLVSPWRLHSQSFHVASVGLIRIFAEYFLLFFPRNIFGLHIILHLFYVCSLVHDIYKGVSPLWLMQLVTSLFTDWSQIYKYFAVVVQEEVKWRKRIQDSERGDSGM